MVLIVYFTLAFVLTWALLPLVHWSSIFALVALFGPAAAAFITAAWLGVSERRDLVARVTCFGVPVRWYAIALLLPIPISLFASALTYVAGVHGPIQFQPISPLGLVVFVLVVGEEIGWRGF